MGENLALLVAGPLGGEVVRAAVLRVVERCVQPLPGLAQPGVGWLAFLWDTEGNSFGVMQDDKNAK